MPNTNSFVAEFKKPTRLIDRSKVVFSTYLMRKSQILLAVKLTETLMLQRGFTQAQIEPAKDVVYFVLLGLHGSLETSGSGLIATIFFQNLGYSEDTAFWAGFVVSTAVALALDFTPWGATKMVVATAGGVAGKWCTQWATEKLESLVSREAKPQPRGPAQD